MHDLRDLYLRRETVTEKSKHGPVWSGRGRLFWSCDLREVSMPSGERRSIFDPMSGTPNPTSCAKLNIAVVDTCDPNARGFLGHMRCLSSYVTNSTIRGSPSGI